MAKLQSVIEESNPYQTILKKYFLYREIKSQIEASSIQDRKICSALAAEGVLEGDSDQPTLFCVRL
jgi:hypothetical protein